MREMVPIQADLRNITNVMGTWQAMLEMFDDPGNLNTLSSLGAEAAIQAFNEGMDMSAIRDPASFGHMYDWEQLGMESGRLWRVLMGGTANSKIVTWDYKQSTRPVPRDVNPTDTRRTVEIFRWKAPMIEQGARVSISPTQPHGWLAIPTKQPTNTRGKSRRRAGTMWFTKHTQNVDLSGKGQGSFTQAWMSHFSTVALKIVDEVVVEEVEHFVDNYDEVYKELPAPRLNPRPQLTKAYIESKLGHTIGRRKTGHFMNKEELERQALRIQRISDGLE